MFFLSRPKQLASSFHARPHRSRRCGVWFVWKASCSERTSRNCYEDDDALRVRCLWSQFAMLHFSSFASGVQWIFLFRKPCRSNLGPSGDSGWVAKTAEDLSNGAQTAKTWSRWRFSETWAPNVFLAAWSPLSSWSEMARYLRRFELQQSQAWAKMKVSVGLWLRMYGYSSLHTNAKARESSKNT